MKLTLKQVVESKDALQHLMDCKLPVKTAYNLQRDLRKVLVEIESFNQFHDQKVKELGEEVMPGKYRVKQECMQEYQEVVSELLTSDIELDLRQVSLDDLKSVDLSVRDMLLLEYLIKEEAA